MAELQMRTPDAAMRRRETRAGDSPTPDLGPGAGSTHLVNPPHRLAVIGVDEDGAIVDDDLDLALVVLDA